jgi:hypothetical protein
VPALCKYLSHVPLLYYPWVAMRLASQYGRSAVSCGVRLEERGDVSGSTRVASPHAVYSDLPLKGVKGKLTRANVMPKYSPYPG